MIEELEEMRAKSKAVHAANLNKINHRIETLREIRRQQNMELMKLRQAKRNARAAAYLHELGERMEKLASQ